MCGIFAALCLANSPRHSYLSSLDELRRRGPDHIGHSKIHDSNGDYIAWLGHTRLSILDLDSRSNQPLFTNDHRYSIVYNGEIYNYKDIKHRCEALGYQFQTASDTEVLLAAFSLFGVDILGSLYGMFTFVIVDAHLSVAYVARDHLGIKPLYYTHSNGNLILSSEIPPLLPYAKPTLNDLNHFKVFEYIRYGASIDPDTTIFSSIHSLPSSSYLKVNLGSDTQIVQRKWSYKQAQYVGSYTDAVHQYRDIFLSSVSQHLQADVPIATALSGGIDSTSIVASLRHLYPSRQITTFSYIPEDSALSEKPWIQIASNSLNTDQHYIYANPSSFVDQLHACVNAQGEPFGSTSILAQSLIYRSVREHNFPVFLEGQGADEILAGYYPMLATYVRSLLFAGNFKKAFCIITSSAAGPSDFVFRLSQYIFSILPPNLRDLYKSLLSRSTYPTFLNSDFFCDSLPSKENLYQLIYPSFSDLRDHLIDATYTTSLPTLLRIVDRNSMSHSVESRVPFLYPPLVNFLSSLPADFFVDPRGTTKRIHRDAMRGILPDQIVARKDKVGFAADDRLFLLRHASFYKELIPILLSIPYFNPVHLNKYLNNFFSHGQGNPAQVQRLFIFALWYQRHIQKDS